MTPAPFPVPNRLFLCLDFPVRRNFHVPGFPGLAVGRRERSFRGRRVLDLRLLCSRVPFLDGRIGRSGDGLDLNLRYFATRDYL